MTLSVGPDKNVILITGPPDNGRDESITQVLPILKDKKVGYYHVFAYMQKIAPDCAIPNLTRRNVFDISKEKLDEIREKAFLSVINDIQNANNEIDIVSTPAVFKVSPRRFYTSGTVEGVNLDILNRLAPKLVLVFIDDLLRVKKRVDEDELRQGMKLNLKDLAEWRESSIQIIKEYVERMIAKSVQVDFIIFAKEHPASTLAQLILNERPRIYLSYHITGQEDFRDVQRLINKLEDTFVCLNPYAIKDWKIVTAFDVAKEEDKKNIVIDMDYQDGTKVCTKIPLAEAEEAIDLIRAQIVERDLDLISNVHATVVYHKDKTPSYGVMVEVFHSNRVERPVYVLYPFKIRPSPFFENYVKHRNIVQGEEDIEKMENLLVAKLKKEYPEWVTWTAK